MEIKWLEGGWGNAEVRYAIAYFQLIKRTKLGELIAMCHI